MKKIIAVIALLLPILAAAAPGNRIDLSGNWKVSLDDQKTFSAITLPGTLDDAGLGEADTLKPALRLPQLQSLRRKHSYIGEAYYTREFNVPAALAGKPLGLTLERVLWQSAVWIDGKQLEGEEESLTTPHHYMVSGGLSAGNHTILIRIDNRKRYDISRNELAHAYTNDTQIKWNGVLGTIAFDAFAPVEVAHVDVYPHLDRSADLKIRLLRTDPSQKEAKLTITSDSGKKISLKAALDADETVFETKYALNPNAELWDEFNPALHKITVSCGKSSKEVTFGIREVTTSGRNIKINGRNIFLRGTLDCCIFPLTGTPPTDEAGWEKVIGTCKEWGLNHIRFHSYCPPDAAFRVADRMGFYLQPELPIWSSATEREPVQKFLMAETDRILDNYGNHASFCLFSGGNELDRGYDYLNNWLRYLKGKDSRHIYTNCTYSMGAGHKGHPEPEDQYYIASRSYLGQIRGQDYIDKNVPDFRSDYSATAIDLGLPMVSHEVGQYSVYPDIREIDKYTGVLSPLPLLSVREDLKKKGMLDKAENFTLASGRLAAILYKEEVERALRTSGLSGFQLLGLQDFPGQSSALVGLVDAFWDNKGLVSEAWFRQACSPVTPLALIPKMNWTADETFSTAVSVANYWKKDIDGDVVWTLAGPDGTVAEGSFHASIPNGCTTALPEAISASLASVKGAAQLKLTVSIKNTDWSNSWDVWVYPASKEINAGEVVLARTMEEAQPVLEKGGKVILSPDPATLKGSKGKFVPVFWSPVFFPAQAGTMGLLCNPSHPALKLFPTEMHSNWQWWALTKNSCAADIDLIPGAVSIIDAIDNLASNRRLSYIYEQPTDKGTLIVSTMDLLSDRALASPESRQLLRSLVEYIKTK